VGEDDSIDFLLFCPEDGWVVFVHEMLVVIGGLGKTLGWAPGGSSEDHQEKQDGAWEIVNHFSAVLHGQLDIDGHQTNSAHLLCFVGDSSGAHAKVSDFYLKFWPNQNVLKL